MDRRSATPGSLIACRTLEPWNPQTLGPSKSPARIAGMFDDIAGRYDLLNHVLSVGLDRSWRARALASLSLTGRETLLDICAGTADVGLAARRGSRGAARVIALDFAGAMLRVARGKVQRSGLLRSIHLVQADATRLPLPDASVDAATIAFGIRNVEVPSQACEEIARVLRGRGRLAILEFGVPSMPGLRGPYLWYFRHVLPRIGRAVSGHASAYAYLPASVDRFPPAVEFAHTLERAGLAEVRIRPLTGGIVNLYTAVKP